ncbi:MAG: saccharopine dehydrogenase NADP-binding domain-containing protein [Actinomycetes bacterium]
MRSGSASRAKGRVIVLGGAGLFGRDVVRVLAASPLVSEIVVASRDLDVSRRFTASFGSQVHAAEVDVGQEGQLRALAVDASLVVNTAGPEALVVLPALKEAIAAGTDYCDLCADGRVAEEARGLDGEAKSAGMTALLGAGIFPGLSNLTMLRAARQLDSVSEVRHCILFVVARDSGGPWTLLPRWQRTGRVDASWQMIMRSLTGPVRVVDDGSLAEVEPWQTYLDLTSPSGRAVRAYPVGLSEPVTLPDTVHGLRRCSSLWSFFPPEVNDRALALGRHIAAGELSESGAALQLHEHLTAQPRQALEPPADLDAPWVSWAEAFGTRDGREAISRCWPQGAWPTTEGLLGAAALRILRGEVNLSGVLAPEACLDPLPYFKEAARLVGAEAPGEGLLGESLTYSD